MAVSPLSQGHHSSAAKFCSGRYKFVTKSFFAQVIGFHSSFLMHFCWRILALDPTLKILIEWVQRSDDWLDLFALLRKGPSDVLAEVIKMKIKDGRLFYSIVDISELAETNKTTLWFHIFRDRRFPEPSRKIGKRFYYPEPEAKKIIRKLTVAK
jgi:hypothetical protein